MLELRTQEPLQIFLTQDIEVKTGTLVSATTSRLGSSLALMQPNTTSNPWEMFFRVRTLDSRKVVHGALVILRGELNYTLAGKRRTMELSSTCKVVLPVGPLIISVPLAGMAELLDEFAGLTNRTLHNLTLDEVGTSRRSAS